MSDSAKDVLVITLQAAVPLHIDKVRRLSAAERSRLARSAADTVAAHGDNILFKSKKAGDTAHAFNELARGLAVLALQPGGVTFAGCHWEVEPDPDDVEADVCPRIHGRNVRNVPTGDNL